MRDTTIGVSLPSPRRFLQFGSPTICIKDMTSMSMQKDRFYILALSGYWPSFAQHWSFVSLQVEKDTWP